jgi:hypothetical protein
MMIKRLNKFVHLAITHKKSALKQQKKREEKCSLTLFSCLAVLELISMRLCLQTQSLKMLYHRARIEERENR